ncbi:DUF2914 domain-containing protein [Desulfuromonas sp. AOP6]|uniref:DUF2914 domain-containing protein n=1 Tax=Desulfuromonas sp. AOP6 TaxID=1566351 RepID=UPI00127067A1|nr:DUF2914 domain-containing protein [Desulfuromonas sp. AOP6]BCA80276.1 hypothetical protein AOP6_2063 [Desulfuromonas sp. AOP6]
MKRLSVIAFVAVLAAWLSLPVSAFALEVAEGVITSQVSDRNPVDSLTSYSADVGKLYCFTRIVGAESDSQVTHVWYRGDEEMARVDLAVRSNNWRTWSLKALLPEWVGDWRVDVLDADGTVISTIPFTLN